jgi:DNA-binding FadR family transcriptional regulator
MEIQLRLDHGFSEFKAKTAAEQLVDRLITAVALGELVKGQKLPPEREFATRLDVSRATLRDALHQLASMGYVTIRRGRSGGVWINSAWGPSSPGHIRDLLLPRWQHLQWLFDLANTILPLIAHKAAERRTPADLATLEAAVLAYANASERDALRTADHAIHSAIAAATHNPYYVSIDTQLRDQLTFGTGALPFNAEIRERALRDHRALAESIAEGDGTRAAELAHDHFVDLAEEPMFQLRERVLAGED